MPHIFSATTKTPHLSLQMIKHNIATFAIDKMPQTTVAHISLLNVRNGTDEDTKITEEFQHMSSCQMQQNSNFGQKLGLPRKN